MTLATSDFDAFHAAVHGGKQPFAWQQRLLAQIVADKAWPRVLDLPTGAGKTTCIDVALFALALDAANEHTQRWCPRRIAMIVDRRIVVDQVAERGRKLLSALMTSTDPVVSEVAKRLRSLTRTGEEPLGVFTLRGGMPKDDGWARTPDQPLVIASTVDQVGSRMLIQGYGVSQGMKPVHAGLLANDTLLLLDEVHLSEPFRQTLDQLARLRARFTSSGVKTRFSHTFLSATPGASEATPFALVDDEKMADSPLGQRLHASKPVRLIEADNRTALEKACIDQAQDLLERHRTIAVVVNRLARAAVIARQLTEMLGKDALVTLLTGRMRPLDRDDVLRELRPAVQTGRSRSDDGPKRVIVGTQCLEAGADFDFDALVSEAASLDSLRQRFGRVDRLGKYGKAEGVVVHDRSAKDDPVYGKAITETVRWFKEQEKERPKTLKDELKKLKDAAKKLRGDAKTRADANLARKAQVDFGVLALDVPTGDDLTKLLAPRPNAPTLLPVYLDLWAQTSPAPSQLPDVSLWLHGPASGPADVQVVWRTDLTEDVLVRDDVEAATAIVAAVRPSSLEAMSLPFVTARAWLANQAARDLGDTEGASPDDSDERESAGRRALRWKGDESEIVDATTLKPGHTIVVPATYGGIRSGCFDAMSTDAVSDRAEQAGLFGRAHPVLRLHPFVVEQLGLTLPLDEVDEARAGLGRLASNTDWPAWKRLWAERLAAGRGSFVVPGEPSWTVLEAKRLPIADLRRVLQPEDTLEDGVELTTDGDDSNLANINKPSDFTRSSYEAIALASVAPTAVDLLAGLACVVGEEASESTLCAANGASHQNLVQSIRDVLKLVEVEHIRMALFEPWRRAYRVPDDKRKELKLGTRKPTLRLDPSDERLYALRLSNPTTTDDFSTELGAQALAIPAFALLPVVPGKQPVTVASKRSRQRVTFSWVLWNVPAGLRTVRSLAWAGAGRPTEQRERGVFAAFSADRISRAKGKLSFAPSQGVW